MSTPDITKAQLAAIAQAIIGVLVAFGINLTQPQQTSLLGLVTVLGAALVTADAIIRHGRARALTPSPAVIDLNPARRTAESTTPPVPAQPAIANAQMTVGPPTTTVSQPQQQPRQHVPATAVGVGVPSS